MPAKQVAPGLGNFATYTHPDDAINATKLIRAVAQHNLDAFVDLFPQVRSSTHVFQSACRSVESSRGTGSVEVQVDEVVNDSVEIIYQITRMVRDKKQRVIEHPKAMTLAFDKALERIDVRQLEDYDALRGLEDAIRSHFKANTKTVHGQKIRNAVRDVILRIGGQNVRRKAGGLYFVPQEWTSDRGREETLPILDSLADLLHTLYGDRGDFYVIPAPDTDYMREMVGKHFQINALRESGDVLERAVQRVRAGKSTRGVRSDFKVNLINDYRRLAGALDQFEQMVGVERTEIEANLNDIAQAINDLDSLDD